MLCSVPQQASVLQEMRRVLRAGGELRFCEHVPAHNRVGLALQRAADATFWPCAFGNRHTARDTQTAIEEAGFVIEQSKRLRFAAVEPTRPHTIGIARRI